MKYKAVMFDLDGTLADTLGDIAAAANHAFTQMGQPTQTLERFRYLAGQGLERLFTDALPPAECERVEAYMKHFKAYYAEHNMDTSKLYPSIADLLDAIPKGMDPNLCLTLGKQDSQMISVDLAANPCAWCHP